MNHGSIVSFILNPAFILIYYLYFWAKKIFVFTCKICQCHLVTKQVLLRDISYHRQLYLNTPKLETNNIYPLFSSGSNAGYSGSSFDRWVGEQSLNHGADNTINKMQHQFWVAKQTILRRIGKKEDECIIASDAELDAKLELFLSIQETCSQLHKVIEHYQERLYGMFLLNILVLHVT